MAFTGKLGTADSQLGNIVLAYAPSGGESTPTAQVIGYATGTSSSTSLSVLAPTRQVGDLLIAYANTLASSGSGESFTTPSGWDLIVEYATSVGIITDCHNAAYYRYADNTSADNFAPTRSNAASWIGAIVVLRNTAGRNPIDDYGASGQYGVFHDSMPVSTSQDNEVVLRFVGGVTSSSTWTPPTGHTEIFDTGGITAAYTVQATATAPSTTGSARFPQGGASGESVGIAITISPMAAPITEIPEGGIVLGGSATATIAYASQFLATGEGQTSFTGEIVQLNDFLATAEGQASFAPVTNQVNDFTATGEGQASFESLILDTFTADVGAEGTASFSGVYIAGGRLTATGEGQASFAAVTTQQNTFTAQGEGSVTAEPLRTYLTGLTVGAEGSATWTTYLTARVRPTFTGEGQASFTSQANQETTFTAQAEGQATFNGKRVVDNSVTAAGEGAASFDAQRQVSNSLVTSGEGQANFVPLLDASNSFNAQGEGRGTFQGKRVVNGSLSASGEGTASFTPKLTRKISLTPRGEGQAAFSPQADFVVNFAARGEGQATNLTGIIHPTSFNAKAEGTARFKAAFDLRFTSQAEGQATFSPTADYLTSLDAGSEGSASFTVSKHVDGELTVGAEGTASFSGKLIARGQPSLRAEGSASFTPYLNATGIVSLRGEGQAAFVPRADFTASFNATAEGQAEFRRWQSIASALRDYLVSQDDLTALVGNRIYPLQIPQDAALPAICYSMASNEHDHILTGASGIARVTFELWILAESWPQKLEVSRALKSALDDYSGDMGAVTTYSSLVVDEQDEDDAKEQTFVRSIDCRIMYQESVPSLSFTANEEGSTLEESLFAYLTQEIAGVVGNRIYPGYLPQGVSYPAIVYQRTSAGDDVDLNENSGIDFSAFSLTILSPSYLDATNTAQYVRNVLHGLSGQMGETAALSVLLDDESDAFFIEAGGDQGYYAVNVDYRLIVRDGVNP